MMGAKTRELDDGVGVPVLVAQPNADQGPVDLGEPSLSTEEAMHSRSPQSGHSFVVTSFTNPADARAMCVQKDGAILVVGTAGNPEDAASRDVAVVRYRVDGQLDESFAGGGRSLIHIVDADDAANAVALQADGKIILAGEVIDSRTDSLDFVVLRLNGDGTLDPTFNETGVAITDFLGGDDRAYSVAVQSDGKIVVAGYTTANDSDPAPQSKPNESEQLRNEYFAVARYRTDGILDDTFGVSGLAITPFPGDLARAYAVCLDSSGNILAAGFARSAPNDHACDFAAVRYRQDGSLDESFGSYGRLLIDVKGTDDTARAIALQPDGKILLAGIAADKAAGTVHFLIVRVDEAGLLDTTFNDSGVVLESDFIGTACAVAIADNGRIVVAGTATVSASGDEESDREVFALAVYQEDGSSERTLGDAGVMRIDLGAMSHACGLAIRPGGRLAVAGTTQTTGTSDFALVHVETDTPTFFETAR